MKRWTTSVVLGLVLLVAGASHAQTPADAALLQQILEAQDTSGRGASSVGTMVMRIRTSNWERALTLKVWSEGTTKTLVVIEAPAKEKGTATLKVDQNIWNYLPKVDRTVKIPGSMMSSSWMGSHLSNDDLVRESRFAEHFRCTFAEKPAGAQGRYVIDCIPKPNAPVVWGKVRIRARAEDKLAEEITYYDEKNALARTVAFSDFAVVAGRKMARVMRTRPADKPDEFTELQFVQMAFDVKHSEQTFTLQALKR